MKDYICYIKSPDEAPDFTDEATAESMEQAIRIFTFRINQFNDDHWTEEEIAPHVMELEVETEKV